MIAAAATFIVSLCTATVLLTRFGAHALDRPNERSLHQRPVPRTGGIAVAAGIAASLAFGAGELWLQMALAFALALVSFIDDIAVLPVPARLAAHFAAAAALVWYVLSPMQSLELALLILVVVWMTNLYNFMDGADGLAGGMALAGFSAYALAAHFAGQAALATLCGAVAAAALAFLLFNFHPARLFLGDVGSIPLGFLSGALGITGWRNDAWPLWFPLLVFAPFVGDATITLLKRTVKGERVWQAHREHYYQRLVRMGFGHRGAALMAYAAMLLCLTAALIGRTQAPGMQAAIFGGTTLVLAAFAVWIDLRWERHLRSQGPA
jgi:UDP-N-acetylmuramyl pentapeptide phosphotransferase/UDP-N-acetylglucosamine-1-phosphate transferase